MRFTDNDSLAQNAMANDDILAGTDVSTGTDKKFTLANLGAWFLENFNGTIGGKSQSVLNAIESKADAEGVYDTLTAGTAGQLLSEAYTENFEPYKFRRSPYTDRLSESIVGASVAWNQYAKNNLSTKTVNGVTFTNNGDGTFNISGTATGNIAQNMNGSENFALGAGHKYFVLGCPSGGSASTYSVGLGGLKIDYGNGGFWTNTNNYPNSFPSFNIANGVTVNFTKVRLMAIDLTAMFGSTVADALYAMGEDGVALFRSWYPSTYYAYSAPTLEHVSGLESHDMVGFNRWDEQWEVGTISRGENVDGSRIRSKNYIPIVSDATYYAKVPASYGNVWVSYYDSEKNYIVASNDNGVAIAKNAELTIPSNARYMRFSITGVTTYNHDICINISDPTRNGTYKPYSKHTYALDVSLTLRGILKYDSANGIYADGDVYEADGTVLRKYKELTLDGSETWSLQSINDYGIANFSTTVTAYKNAANSICDKFAYQTTSISATQTEGYLFSAGIYLYIRISSSKANTIAGFKTWLASNPVTVVYEVTPTTESAEPFDAIQITDGTEEYITDCLVPVGHESKYYENLRSKIEGLPTDFSAIICATEPTSKASRNYAIGDYLIYNNTLYKVTTAIAANATLTVGTNITATTIMAEIKALQ